MRLPASGLRRLVLCDRGLVCGRASADFRRSACGGAAPCPAGCAAASEARSARRAELVGGGQPGSGLERNGMGRVAWGGWAGEGEGAVRGRRNSTHLHRHAIQAAPPCQASPGPGRARVAAPMLHAVAPVRKVPAGWRRAPGRQRATQLPLSATQRCPEWRGSANGEEQGHAGERGLLGDEQGSGSTCVKWERRRGRRARR